MRFVKREVIHGILWTVACTLLFFWFFSLAVRSFINAEHQKTIYTHKFCPVHYGGR